MEKYLFKAWWARELVLQFFSPLERNNNRTVPTKTKIIEDKSSGEM
jgi:hypothetical protein